jgi:hypothetical protein
MSRRRRLRRRLFWVGVLLGLVLLYAAISALRLGVWCRDLVVKPRKGGTMYGKFSLAAVVAAIVAALAAPAAWSDPWAADRHAHMQEAQLQSTPMREPVGDDHFRDPPNVLPATAANGTNVPWQELGLGLGFAIVVGLGVFLAVRPTRVRPLPR